MNLCFQTPASRRKDYNDEAYVRKVREAAAMSLRALGQHLWGEEYCCKGVGCYTSNSDEDLTVSSSHREDFDIQGEGKDCSSGKRAHDGWKEAGGVASSGFLRARLPTGTNVIQAGMQIRCADADHVKDDFRNSTGKAGSAEVFGFCIAGTFPSLQRAAGAETGRCAAGRDEDAETVFNGDICCALGTHHSMDRDVSNGDLETAGNSPAPTRGRTLTPQPRGTLHTISANLDTDMANSDRTFEDSAMAKLAKDCVNSHCQASSESSLRDGAWSVMKRKRDAWDQEALFFDGNCMEAADKRHSHGTNV